MSGLTALKALLDSGEFHHATYRCQGTVWEGLWVYRRDPDGFRGYSLKDCPAFMKGDPDLEAAFSLCHGTGISLGSYGVG